MIEISQYEAARLPYRSKYPTSKLIAYMLDKAGLLRPFKPVHIIDVTYGQGIFWHALRSKAVVAGADIRKLDWVIRPRCFIQRPVQHWREWLTDVLECLGGRVDVVVTDPPWQTWQRGCWKSSCAKWRTHYHAANAWGRPEDILNAATELARELNVPLLYHWKEPLEYQHLVGPVAFKPFFHVFNPKAESYRSYFGIVRV